MIINPVISGKGNFKVVRVRSKGKKYINAKAVVKKRRKKIIWDFAHVKYVLHHILSAFIVGLFLLIYVWQHVTTVTLNYKTTKLQKRKQGLLNEQRCLRLEAALLKSPKRIKRLAGRLGYIESRETDKVIIIIDESGKQK